MLHPLHAMLAVALLAATARDTSGAPAPNAHRAASDTARLSTYAADSSAIRAAIERGARGFERGDPDSIISHYAKDVVLSYPGIPDQDYATLAAGYAELRGRPAHVRATTTPTFDEILVTRDLAVVRVRWTTTIQVAATDSTPARESTRFLRDLQVWRREPGGAWRFIRGMHYRDSTAAPVAPRR